jgi:hypothetical protein
MIGPTFVLKSKAAFNGPTTIGISTSGFAAAHPDDLSSFLP